MAAWRDTSHLAPGVPMKEREVVDMGDGTAVVFRRRVMSASDNPLNELEKICAIAADAQKEKLAALARITELEKERDQYKVEFDATADQELDAAQTLAADYCANTGDALSQRDDAREEADRQCNKKVAALRTAGDNAEAGHKLMIALDAALARIKVLEEEASLIRVAQSYDDYQGGITGCIGGGSVSDSRGSGVWEEGAAMNAHCLGCKQYSYSAVHDPACPGLPSPDVSAALAMRERCAVLVLEHRGKCVSDAAADALADLILELEVE